MSASSGLGRGGRVLWTHVSLENGDEKSRKDHGGEKNRPDPRREGLRGRGKKRERESEVYVSKG